MNTRHPIADELELYVLGALEGDVAARLERHVRRCPPCAVALAEEARLETTLRALVAARRAPAKVVPLPVPAAPERSRPGLSGTLAAAAAILLSVWGLGSAHRVSTGGPAAVVAGEGPVCELEGEVPLCPWPAAMASMAVPATPVEGGTDICRAPASCPLQSRLP